MVNWLELDHEAPRNIAFMTSNFDCGLNGLNDTNDNNS